MQPSLLYARPQPPSDVTSDNFQWGEDAASTIAPEDSVSNLDRRFTGKRRILGPRAMDASSPAIPEEDTDAYHVEALRDAYVEPERIRSPAPQGPRDPSDEDRRLQQQQSFDDQTTAVPTTSSGSYATRETGAVRAVNPSTAGARGRGAAAAGLAPVPYASATASAYDEDYAPLRHAPEDDSRPLVSSSGSGYRAGPDASAASRTVAPYLPRSQSAKGYAVLGEEGHDGDAGYDDEPYEAYKTPRSGPRAYRDEEAAHSEGAGDRGLVTAANSQGLVGALSNPFGYIKQSWRGRDGGQQSRRQESFYPPDELAFDPPKDDYNGSSYPPHVPYTGSASYHHPTASLDKIPSLDVVPPQDGFSNRSPYYNPTKAGPRGEMIEPAPLWRRWVWDTTDPERRVWEHRTGRGMQRWPFASWTLAVIMTAVLVYELVNMKAITGSPIQTKPSVNVMIGPSAEVLIHQGARFAGCMKYIPDVTNIAWTCPNATNSDVVSSSAVSCTMSDVCGFGGFDSQTDGAGGPDQSFRFFVPIFLHAGVVHLLFNMLAQCTSSAIVERMMGTPKFLALYLAAGIAGFVLGANFALVGQPSVGASGAIFGTQAALLVDLLAHWKIEYRPKRKLLMLIIEVIIGFGLGWVPGIDNFAHLGGFAMGLLVSLLFFPIIHPSRTHKLVFVALRILVLPLIVVFYVVLVRNFYTSDPATACSWCAYLSCWPTAANNHCKGTGLSTYSTSSFYLPSLFTIFVSTMLLPSL